MGVWDQIKRAKVAGQRVLEKYDSVEAEARAGDPDRIARDLSKGSTETKLGVTEFEGEESSGLHLGGEIFIERDDGQDSGASHSHSIEQDFVSTERIDRNVLDAELNSMDNWEAEDHPFGLGLDVDDATDEGFNPSLLGEYETDPFVDITEGKDTTAKGIVISEETDPACDLLDTDSGKTEKIVVFGLPHKETDGHLPDGKFAQRAGASTEQREELARFEVQMLENGERLGAAALDFLEAYLRSDGSILAAWESAIWVTGVHWDTDVRENLRELAKSEIEEDRKISLRCLAWSILDDIEELRDAALGAEDRYGLLSGYSAVIATMKERSEFLASNGLEELETIEEELPIEPSGNFSADGFG